MLSIWLLTAAFFATLGMFFAFLGKKRGEFRFSKIALLWMLGAGILLFIAVWDYMM